MLRKSLLALALALAPVSAQAQEGVRLERVQDQYFSIERPAGWQVEFAGHCSVFAFVIRDPSRPARQLFYFGSVGPLTLSQQQRSIDLWYMQNSGYPIPQVQFPVLEPATPANFMAVWPAIAHSPIAAQFMPGRPMLENLQPISEVQTPSPFADYGGASGLVRALFVEGGELAEGLFHMSLVPEAPFMNGPGGHTGRAVMFMGVTAPKDEFAALAPTLMRALGSFAMSDAYVQRCRQDASDAWNGVLQAGQVLRESSEDVIRAYEERRRVDDIRSARDTDRWRDVERLHDPDTGEVYEFPNGFYDAYRLDPQKHRLTNLEPLPPDDHRLWTAAPKDGPRAMQGW